MTTTSTTETPASVYDYACEVAIAGFAGEPTSRYSNDEITQTAWSTPQLLIDTLLDRGSIYIHAMYPNVDHYLLCSHIHNPTRAAIDSAISTLRERTGWPL